MTLVPATVRCWWDAHVRPSSVWARLAADAEAELENADLTSGDWYLPCELFEIAADLAALAQLLELRADLSIEKDAA